jgi:uncharacterized membrane protein YfcA
MVRGIAGMRSLTAEIGTIGLMVVTLTMAAGAAAQVAIGLGLNLFAVAILALINPVFVPGPILINSFLLSIAASAQLRKDIDFREFGVAIGGLLTGTVAAAIVLAVVVVEQLSRLFGVLIVAAVAMATVGARVPLTYVTVFAASAAAGTMGTIAGVHGPPMALVYQHASPPRIRAALLPFFIVASMFSLAALAMVGSLGWRELCAAVLLLPGLVAGYVLAPLLVRLLSPAAVRTVLLFISGASGVALIIKS